MLYFIQTMKVTKAASIIALAILILVSAAIYILINNQETESNNTPYKTQVTPNKNATGKKGTNNGNLPGPYSGSGAKKLGFKDGQYEYELTCYYKKDGDSVVSVDKGRVYSTDGEYATFDDMCN